MKEPDLPKLMIIAGAKRAHGERWGQSVFNAAYELDPERTDRLRSTDVDPFYRDDRVDAFLAAWATD